MSKNSASDQSRSAASSSIFSYGWEESQHRESKENLVSRLKCTPDHGKESQTRPSTTVSHTTPQPTSSCAGIKPTQENSNTSLRELGDLVTGKEEQQALHPSLPESQTRPSTTVSPTPAQPTSSRAGWWCLGITTILIVVILLVVGSIFFFVQHHSSRNPIPSNNNIIYENDTIIVARISTNDYKVSIEHVCSYDSYTLSLFVAQKCDLAPHTKALDSDCNYINSTRTTITEVRFAWKSSHIYLVAKSKIHFNVEIISSVPARPVKLVVFNNYTYFSDYTLSLSNNPSTAKAFLVKEFDGSTSNYTFTTDETNTYFFAVESKEGTNYSYSYDGTVYYYNHTDYEENECDLPYCKVEQCEFESSNHVLCVLAYVKPTFSGRTFAYIRTFTSQMIVEYKYWLVGEILLPSTLLTFLFLILIISFYAYKKKYLQRFWSRLLRRNPRNLQFVNRALTMANYGTIDH